MIRLRSAGGLAMFAVYMTIVGGSAACGPQTLPDFANPPPPPDAGSDAATNLDDAGSERLDGSPR